MSRKLIRDAEIQSASAFSENARRYFHMPGIVQAFYPGVAGQSPAMVDVQPAVNDVRLCVQAGMPPQPAGAPALIVGQTYPEPWPILHKIPVRYPSGNGLAIWWNLKKGDRVELEALDLDPTTFRTTGQQGDPILTRRNSGAHWTCVPGDTSDPGALPDAGNSICIGTPNGVIIAVNGSTINLGTASPTDAVALASIVDGIWTALVAAVQAVAGPSPSTPVTAGSLLGFLQAVWAGTGVTPVPAKTSASNTVKAVANTP